MYYILHGDDIVASRNHLSQLTDGFSTFTLDGKTLQIKDLEEKLLAGGLFDVKRGVVVENLLSKNPKKKEFINFLNENEVSCLLILWEDKKLLKSSTMPLKKAKIEEFLLPSYYFKFLDGLAPQNKKQSFALYQELLKTYAPEQVFYSLFKRIRQLVVLSSGSKNEELMKMAPWQISNLKRQLQMWSEEGLTNFYESLKQTEIKLKTGGLPLALSKHLDILILSKLT